MLPFQLMGVTMKHDDMTLYVTCDTAGRSFELYLKGGKWFYQLYNIRPRNDATESLTGPFATAGEAFTDAFNCNY